MKSIKNDFSFEDDDLSLDLTPLIDVIFMLVIFFVLTTTFSKPVIDMILPKSTSAVVDTNHKYISIVIDKVGDYYFDNKKISLSEIRALLDEKNELPLNIVADQDAPFKSFVGIVDIAKIKRKGRFVISTDLEKSIISNENQDKTLSIQNIEVKEAQ
ncbi:MAG: biopolymer transporter ExbD [Ruminobacter sp.]|nr:biopolymer transporter ExbD [Ruminobacter sp.]